MHDAELDQPCLQIQMDLSAMLDGELDAASVRRVMVHSDVCPSCRDFLRGIRLQARLHRSLHELDKSGEKVGYQDALPGDPGRFEGASDELRRQLVENRAQLARILYELGRAYVLMGVSPKFSRMVAREPVPLPEMYLRGRHLVDEVERMVDGSPGVEWVRAKSLFSGDELLDAVESLAKGQRLLREALVLRPDFHEARIYLGHAYHVAEERAAARRELRAVLAGTDDPIMRGFALENLGNVYLEEGRLSESLRYFHELVDSGVIEKEWRFFTTYFNLALAYGLMGRFDDCRTWLSRLYEEFPHKRRMSRDELAKRAPLLAAVDRRPDVAEQFAELFPDWFPMTAEVA